MFTLYWITFVPTQKAILYSVNSNGTALEQNWGGWPKSFSELNPSPHFWILTSVSVDSSRCSYLFTSGTVRIPVDAAPKCGTEIIPVVTLHLRDRCGTASLRYKNRAEITVLMCEQKSYPVWFSYWRKSDLLYRKSSIKRPGEIVYFKPISWRGRGLNRDGGLIWLRK